MQPIWPQPTGYTFATSPWPNGKLVQLAAKFAFTCNKCPSELTAAIGRYRNIIFFAGAPSLDSASDTPMLATCSVNVKDTTAALEIGMDESYEIQVTTTGATINAQTQWGAMRGLESFSQLVQWSGDGHLGTGTDTDANTYEIGYLPLNVTDTPRFKWRGMMFDTSRHFLTTASVLHTLDAMSFHKFNVFHWHASDDNSWPLESSTFPNLTQGELTAPSTTIDSSAPRSMQSLTGVCHFLYLDPNHQRRTRSWRSTGKPM
jgi:hexosaminidase